MGKDNDNLINSKYSQTQAMRDALACQARGFSYCEQRQFSKAIEEFDQAIKLASENEHAHFGLGSCYYQENKFDKTIEEFNKVLKINPKHNQVNYHLGLCYYQKGLFLEAIAYFNNAIKSDPAYLLCSREALAQVYFEHNEIGLCLKELQHIKSLGQQSEPYHCIMARIYFKEKRYDAAIEEFDQALKINPQNIDSNDGIGLCYFEQGLAYFQKKQYDLAQEAFNKAIEINANLISMHQDLEVLYSDQGLCDLAGKEFREVFRINGNNIFIYQKLGYIHKTQGKHELSVAEFIKATELYLTREEANRKFINSSKSEPIDLVDSNKFAIKILSMPSFCDRGEIRSTELNTSLLPPLALGQIVAYLRANGVNIDQDDLNIKIHHDNYYSKIPDKEVDITNFLDENRVLKYLSGHNDNELELVMETVEKKSNFCEYGIILLSLPLVFRNSGCLLFTLTLARFLKKRYNPILILGGINQSVELLKKYDCKDIDFIIYNEGEGMLLELLLALKDNAKLTEFLSKHITENGKIIARENYPPMKPDFIGLPIDMYRYKGLNANYSEISREILEEFNKSGALVLPFKFIKGCPYECIFCASSTGKSMHVLKPAVVALYLKELQERYNPTGFFFLSNTVNISKRYINELCDEIIKNNIKILWSDCARADNLDKNTILKLRAAGCIRLIFGMETASPRLLKYINKKIGLGGLENALQWSDEAGIWTGVEIICGLPHEKNSDIEETATFLKRNKKYINSLYFNQFDLRDGSLLLKHPDVFGLENITEINQYADKEFGNYHKYSYDEANGLRWHDKRKQILDSYKKLLGEFNWNPYFPVYEFEHFLFFLYNKFNDKKQIYDIFSKAAEEKNRLKNLLDGR